MIALGMALAANAATFDRIPDWAELAEDSRAVIAGTVVEAETVPTAYGAATRYEIAVSRTLHGDVTPDVSDVVWVELPGGRLDGLVQRFSGVPLWDEGDQVVVFLPEDGPMRLAGVLTLDGDRLIDAIGRPDPVRSLADLELRIAGTHPAPAAAHDVRE